MKRFLVRMWVKLIRSQERRAAIRVLYSMSDKQLKDLGITRGEIRSRVCL